MTRRLRKGQGRTGLVLANGGTATYEHAVCLSSNARGDGRTYPAASPLPSILSDVSIPRFVSAASGEAILEVSHQDISISGKSKLYVVGRNARAKTNNLGVLQGCKMDHTA